MSARRAALAGTTILTNERVSDMGEHCIDNTEWPIVLHPELPSEAWSMKERYGSEAVYAAGATLLRTQWESGAAILPGYLIDLSRLPEIREIRVEGDWLVIGALATLSSFLGNYGLIEQHCPAVVTAIRDIAAPSIRNLATIGGNVLSGVGDSIPALLLYDVVLVWQDSHGEQEQELGDWLLQKSLYGSVDSRLLLRIHLPLTLTLPRLIDNDPASSLRRFDRFHKVGRRESFSTSLVTVAICGWIDIEGKLADVRIAAGGGQSVPFRLREAERKLTGKLIDERLLGELYQDITRIYEPQGDLFASAAYRQKTAANLIVAELWQRGSGAGRGDSDAVESGD